MKFLTENIRIILVQNLVDILMPNYNNAPYLKECIDSILNQSFSNFKLLIIDDASTDNSIEIINGFKDPRIELHYRKINGGIVKALNDGLNLVTSKYILRHDGDDLMHSDRIKVLVEFMESNPSFGVCSTDIKTFGAFEKDLIYERDDQMNRANLIFGHSIGHASSIFRAEIFKNNGIKYSDEFKFKEDYDLFYRLNKLTKTTSIPGFYYLYRVQQRHENQVQLKLKQETTMKFYHRILNDLNLPTNDENIALHFELAKNVIPTHKFEKYIDYTNQIILNNDIVQIYPKFELEKVLLLKLTRVFYTQIDSYKLGFFDAMKYAFKIKIPFLKYWISKRVLKG